MSTHAQRIEAVSEMYENGAAENRFQRALASVQAERNRLERQLALKDEAISLLRDALADSEAELDTLRSRLQAAGAGTAADEPTRGSPAPSLETAPASVATS